MYWTQAHTHTSAPFDGAVQHTNYCSLSDSPRRISVSPAMVSVTGNAQYAANVVPSTAYVVVQKKTQTKSSRKKQQKLCVGAAVKLSTITHTDTHAHNERQLERESVNKTE